MKILFVRQYAPGVFSTFIDKDIQILQSQHEVRVFQFSGFKNLPALFQAVQWCDLTFSWFGKLHAFFAVMFSKVLGKKSLVVAGDDDVTNYEVAGRPYGLCAHPVKKWFAYFIFGQSDLVVTISKFGLEEAIHNARAKTEKTRLIYHGFDYKLFKMFPGIAKEDSRIITVANINQENYHRKGLKLFVECAHLLPDNRFVLIGPSDTQTLDLLRSKASQNVTFAGPMEGRDLLEALSEAAVYVQASEWESFGCSVAEAMLCECVPVVSNRTGLPEVVGDAGYYIEHLEPQELADKIEIAMANPQMGKKARQRIIECFPLENRKKELLEAIRLFGDK